MNLPNYLRERFATEVNFAVTRMRNTTDPVEKVYYYSVGSGEATRIMNFHWEPELALIHLVLQTTHGTLNSRVQAMDSPNERVVQLSTSFFQELEVVFENLGAAVGSGRDAELYDLLVRLSELGYLTTGNGYYLHMKGAIKL